MATLPPFSFTISYFLYILAVTITSLLMIIIGGWVKDRFQKKGLRFRFAQKSRFRRKFWGFILFIVAIFLLLAVNDRALIGERGNGHFANAVTGTDAAVALVLGVSNVLRAAAALLAANAAKSVIAVTVARTPLKRHAPFPDTHSDGESHAEW